MITTAKVHVYFKTGEKIDMTEMVESISWSGDINTLPRKVVVDFKNMNKLSQTRKLLEVNNGDMIFVFNKAGGEIFRGYIFQKSHNHEGNGSITAYDALIYAVKNQDTILEKAKTLSDILIMLCKKFGLKTGKIEKTTAKIPKLLAQGEDLAKILEKAQDESRKIDGKNYKIFAARGAVHMVGRQKSTVRNIPIDNVISAENTVSIENLITQVLVTKGSIDPEEGANKNDKGFIDVTGADMGQLGKRKLSGFYNAVVTSKRGMRNGKFHHGWDFAAKKGTRIDCVVDGTVVYAKLSQGGDGYGGYGKVVGVKDKNGDTHIYGHLNSISVKVGSKVKQGQKIGTMGNTGKVYSSNGGDGTHLHYEVRAAGSYRNTTKTDFYANYAIKGTFNVSPGPQATIKYTPGFIATAYAPSAGGINSQGDPTVGSCGTKVKPGRTIAVAPKVIPYGSVVSVRVPNMPDYSGIYLAEDTGGAIKRENGGKRIDILIEPLSKALRFGRRGVEVAILERGTGAADARAKAKKWSTYENKYSKGLGNTKIISSNGVEVDQLDNPPTVYTTTLIADKEAKKKYGTIQKVETADDKATMDQMKAIGKQVLEESNKQEVTVRVDFIGDIGCITGNSIEISDSATGIAGLYYITSDEHTFDATGHHMTLQLSKKLT